MFIANQYFWRQRNQGYDVVGQEILTVKVREKCAVVTQRVETQNTSIRADTSGSTGKSDMKRSKGRWLIDKRSGVDRGDVVWLDKRPQDKFKVEDIHPRYDTIGELDHFEVDLATWQ